MRIPRLLFVALSLLLAGFTGARGATVCVKAARMIDGRSGQTVGPVVVVLDGERIGRVLLGPQVSQAPQDARTIDLGDATLLPGLIDCHTHLSTEPGQTVADKVKLTPARAAIRAVNHARATLEAGFTTVRDVGGYELVDVALRNAINAGEVPGPRMQVAVFALSITGGHGDPNNEFPYFDHFGGMNGVADGPEEVRKKVRFDIQQGADVIKFMATGGVLSTGDSPGAEQFSFEEMQVAVDEARRAGRFTAAHAHGTQGILDAVRAGVRSIEHCSYLTPEIARLMKQKGTWDVPTRYVPESLLVPGNPMHLTADRLAKARDVAQHTSESFKVALREGVNIAFGTDAGVFPHGTQAREFAIYVRDGMTPMQAIQTATGRAAGMIGWQDQVGTIEPGRYADLIAVAGDPLKDITELERVKWVMKGGAVFKDQQGK